MTDELFWGVPVILYLFLAGMGAGATTVSASMLLRNSGTDCEGCVGAFLDWDAIARS